MEISWPYELQSVYASGKHLLYLTELPQASCVSSYQISFNTDIFVGDNDAFAAF